MSLGTFSLPSECSALVTLFFCSLPSGWDKHSYGYHGDDGHSFCSSGTGQPYGPTFTTGDVIGCCVNLINNTCFYTKNGHSLGKAIATLSFLHGALRLPKNQKVPVSIAFYLFIFIYTDGRDAAAV